MLESKISIIDKVDSFLVTINDTTEKVNVQVIESTETTNITIAEQGVPGIQGKSAYQEWLDLGNTGTKQDFLNSLNNVINGGIIF